jgi:large subunit ribosomal protein L21
VQALFLLSEGGGLDTGRSWLLWVALAFFVIIVLVGWLTSRNKGEQVEASMETHAPSMTEKSADDLTVLEGIGPRVAKILSEAGITSFADLAKADAAEVDKVLDANKLQMMDSEGWIEQAKLAATGDMEGLAKLQDELKGGRRAK